MCQAAWIQVKTMGFLHYVTIYYNHSQIWIFGHSAGGLESMDPKRIGPTKIENHSTDVKQLGSR